MLKRDRVMRHARRNSTRRRRFYESDVPRRGLNDLGKNAASKIARIPNALLSPADIFSLELK